MIFLLYVSMIWKFLLSDSNKRLPDIFLGGMSRASSVLSSGKKKVEGTKVLSGCTEKEITNLFDSLKLDDKTKSVIVEKINKVVDKVEDGEKKKKLRALRSHLSSGRRSGKTPPPIETKTPSKSSRSGVENVERHVMETKPTVGKVMGKTSSLSTTSPASPKKEAPVVIDFENLNISASRALLDEAISKSHLLNSIRERLRDNAGVSSTSTSAGSKSPRMGSKSPSSSPRMGSKKPPPAEDLSNINVRVSMNTSVYLAYPWNGTRYGKTYRPTKAHYFTSRYMDTSYELDMSIEDYLGDWYARLNKPNVEALKEQDGGGAIVVNPVDIKVLYMYWTADGLGGTRILKEYKGEDRNVAIQIVAMGKKYVLESFGYIGGNLFDGVLSLYTGGEKGWWNTIIDGKNKDLMLRIINENEIPLKFDFSDYFSSDYRSTNYQEVYEIYLLYLYFVRFLTIDGEYTPERASEAGNLQVRKLFDQMYRENYLNNIPRQFKLRQNLALPR